MSIYQFIYWDSYFKPSTYKLVDPMIYFSGYVSITSKAKERTCCSLLIPDLWPKSVLSVQKFLAMCFQKWLQLSDTESYTGHWTWNERMFGNIIHQCTGQYYHFQALWWLKIYYNDGKLYVVGSFSFEINANVIINML